MKLLTLLLLSFSVHAQVVHNHFIKWSNKEVKSKIEEHNHLLKKSLSHSAFSNEDTINIYFHLPQEYILVTSNLTDSRMTDALYKKIVLHFVNMQANFNYLRFQYFRILVRDNQNKYFKTNYSTLSLSNKSRKLRESRLMNHLSRYSLNDQYLSSLRR